MEALWVLGVVALAAVVHVWVGPWLDRRADRKAEDRRWEAVFAVLRMYGEAPRRRR